MKTQTSPDKVLKVLSLHTQLSIVESYSRPLSALQAQLKVVLSNVVNGSAQSHPSSASFSVAPGPTQNKAPLRRNWTSKASIVTPALAKTASNCSKVKVSDVCKKKSAFAVAFNSVTNAGSSISTPSDTKTTRTLNSWVTEKNESEFEIVNKNTNVKLYLQVSVNSADP